MAGSATTQGPTPQAPTEPDISARSNNFLRTDEKILRFRSRRPRSPPDCPRPRLKGQLQAPACILPLGSGRFRSGLHVPLRRDIRGPTIPRQQSGSNAT